MPPKLGIFAGGGILPVRLIEHCRAIGRPFFVVALQGHCEPATVARKPHEWFRLGAAGAILARLHAEGVSELVMVGPIRRPRLRDLRPDLKGWLILARIWRRFFAGDDKLLRSVAVVLEDEGFVVRGIHEVMGGVLAPMGAFGAEGPDEKARRDISVGVKAARELGARDVGQAVVAQNGVVVAEEDCNGTDAMLARDAILMPGRGGVLIKMRKPQQDMRVDLPSIGPETVKRAVSIGLAGIAVEAGNALVIDMPEVVRAADKAGLFLYGVSPADEQSLTIYLIAGEPSGDRLGARLMSALKVEHPGPLRFLGVGGEMMAREGLTSRFPIDDLSVMGLAEVLPRLPLLMRRIRETVDDIERSAPDILVTIDAPDFGLRVARKVRARRTGRALRLLHYVAPSVWAWKSGRARKMAAYLDRVLTLLPFEPDYFTRVGLDADFVGHPVLESGANTGEGAAFRVRHRIFADAKVVCLLPGSRTGEIDRLMPVLKETVELLDGRQPNLSYVLPTVANMEGRIRAALKDWPRKPQIVLGEEEKFAAFAASDLAIAASGTVALELAMAGTPNIIIYKFNPVTSWLARKLVKSKYVNLVNILLDEEAVPELILENCQPSLIAATALRLLNDPNMASNQRAKLKLALAKLGREGLTPSQAAARSVLDVIKKGRS